MSDLWRSCFIAKESVAIERELARRRLDLFSVAGDDDVRALREKMKRLVCRAPDAVSRRLGIGKKHAPESKKNRKAELDDHISTTRLARFVSCREYIFFFTGGPCCRLYRRWMAVTFLGTAATGRRRRRRVTFCVTKSSKKGTAFTSAPVSLVIF